MFVLLGPSTSRSNIYANLLDFSLSLSFCFPLVSFCLLRFLCFLFFFFWTGISYLSIDDREQCWLPNGRHQKYAYGVAIPALILYAVILPLLTLVYLYSHQKVLLDDRKLVFRFGLLFSGYSQARWYWEIFVILRKIFLIVIVTFAGNSQLQLHFALGALVVMLYLQERGRPFEETETETEDSRAGRAGSPGSASQRRSHSISLRPKKMLTPRTSFYSASMTNADAAANALKEKKSNRLLHTVEVASLLVLLTMVWIAVLFNLTSCRVFFFI